MSGAGPRPAFTAAFREAGLDWHWDEALYGELLAVTGGKERILHYVARHRPDFAKLPDVAERVAALHKAKTRHYTQLAASGAIPLRPGVAPLLHEARAASLRLAVRTTAPPTPRRPPSPASPPNRWSRARTNAPKCAAARWW